MEFRLDLCKTGTEDVVFNSIRKLLHPYGIVLYGADGEAKDTILGKLLTSLPATEFQEMGNRTSITNAFGDHKDVILRVSDGYMPVDSLNRIDDAAKLLRDCGARTILGVMVKQSEPSTAIVDDEVYAFGTTNVPDSAICYVDALLVATDLTPYGEESSE